MDPGSLFVELRVNVLHVLSILILVTINVDDLLGLGLNIIVLELHHETDSYFELSVDIDFEACFF